MVKAEVMVMESLTLSEVVRCVASYKRPFRAPHFTISARSIPMEVEMAGKGFILLDEVDKFSFETLSSLRASWAQMGLDTRPDIILMKKDVESEQGKLALELLRS